MDEIKFRENVIEKINEGMTSSESITSVDTHSHKLISGREFVSVVVEVYDKKTKKNRLVVRDKFLD